MRPPRLVLGALLPLVLAGCTAGAAASTAAVRAPDAPAACALPDPAAAPPGPERVVRTVEGGAGCRDHTAADVLVGPGGSADLDVLRRFAACVRAHGVPDFPDPGHAGPTPRTVPAPFDARFREAERACR